MNFIFNPLTGQFEIDSDYQSGVTLIEENCTLVIKENKQMINFTSLTIDGDLILDGDLWVA